MTNLVLLSITLVTNDVYRYEYKPGNSYLVATNLAGEQLKWGPLGMNYLMLNKKEVWQLYTIGYHTEPHSWTDWKGQSHSSNGVDVSMLTLSNLFGTLEPKQETNWVFTPSK